MFEGRAGLPDDVAHAALAEFVAMRGCRGPPRGELLAGDEAALEPAIDGPARAESSSA
jgi:hypothetical protein